MVFFIVYIRTYIVAVVVFFLPSSSCEGGAMYGLTDGVDTTVLNEPSVWFNQHELSSALRGA